MSNRNSILIIIGILLVVVGGLFFFFFSSNKTPTTTNTFKTNEPTVNPFGTKPVDKSDGTSDSTGGFGQNNTGLNGATRLTQIYRNPTSGFAFVLNKKNQNTLMFVDRAVGHTYSYVPEDQTGEAIRVTNTTIPKIQEAVWANTGNNLVFRYLDNDTDNISSFTGKINLVSDTINTPGDITGLFLTPNIKQLAINPKGDKIFSLIDKSDKSGTYGFTTNIDGSVKKAIFESPISYWNISWPKESTITFTTKPSFRDYGLLYFFNTQTSAMERIIGNVTGLSTVTNKDASLVAYSYSTNNSFALDIYDVAEKISKKINISTLADKCAWGNVSSKILYCAIPVSIFTNSYPDAWYQGLVSFADTIWRIDVETGAITEIYQIGSNENADIDVYDIKVSLDDKHLAFSNKKDLSLWVLQLEE